MSLRLDKFIWSVRITKTRALASEALLKGRIKINGNSTKPSKEVRVGDTIAVNRNAAVFSYEVINLTDKRVGPKLVAEFILDITPQEEIEKLKMYQLAQSNYRSYGTGKPSKKDRRDLTEFFFDWDQETE
jgi:ribosome-associated heat shock protein Hsp15